MHIFRPLLIAGTATLALAACAQTSMEPGMTASPVAMPSHTLASGTVIVGGQPMLPTKNIVANAVNSADHTTLVAAVQAAGLADTLQEPGPFTVFAPTNAAFQALPPGTVEALVKPENQEVLSSILTYHVVPGRLDATELTRQIQAGDGRATLKTASGATLTAMLNGPNNIVIQDAKGQVAEIPTYDVYQSNGIIHVIDTVLLP